VGFPLEKGRIGIYYSIILTFKKGESNALSSLKKLI
jgi:hypothetical protein